jgi:hypothetical protein
VFSYVWSDDIRLAVALPFALAIGVLAMVKTRSENPLGLAIAAGGAAGAVLFGLSRLVVP